jgi:hypothetical protein
VDPDAQPRPGRAARDQRRYHDGDLRAGPGHGRVAVARSTARRDAGDRELGGVDRRRVLAGRRRSPDPAGRGRRGRVRAGLCPERRLAAARGHGSSGCIRNGRRRVGRARWRRAPAGSRADCSRRAGRCDQRGVTAGEPARAGSSRPAARPRRRRSAR